MKEKKDIPASWDFNIDTQRKGDYFRDYSRKMKGGIGLRRKIIAFDRY